MNDLVRYEEASYANCVITQDSIDSSGTVSREQLVLEAAHFSRVDCLPPPRDPPLLDTTTVSAQQDSDLLCIVLLGVLILMFGTAGIIGTVRSMKESWNEYWEQRRLAAIAEEERVRYQQLEDSVSPYLKPAKAYLHQLQAGFSAFSRDTQSSLGQSHYQLVNSPNKRPRHVGQALLQSDDFLKAWYEFTNGYVPPDQFDTRLEKLKCIEDHWRRENLDKDDEYTLTEIRQWIAIQQKSLITQQQNLRYIDFSLRAQQSQERR